MLADICLTRRIGSTLLFGALTVAIIGIPRLSSSMLDLVLSGSPVVASVPIETTAAILALLVVVLAYVPIVRLAVTHALAAENTRAAGGDAAARCEKAARVAGLSVRESEALLCLYEGMSAKQLAQSMVIAESTAKTYAKHVFAKAGVHSRDELAQFVDSL